MRRAGAVLAALCLVGFVFMLCGCGGTGGATPGAVETAKKPAPPPPPPPTPSKIAFHSEVKVGKKTWAMCVRTMNSDGTGVTTLVPGTSPAWSPDGTRIAYVAECELADGRTTWCIYTMDPDGGGQQQVTAPAPYVTQWWDDMSADSSPAWSPEGTQIVFTRGVVSNPDYPYSIQIVDANGGDAEMVVEVSPTTVNMLFCPTWSAADRIAFCSCPVAGGYRIEVVSPDGSGREVLLEDARYPAWSPDGTKLAVNRLYPDAGLWVCEYDVSTNALTGFSQLTTNGLDLLPTWSPDGAEIAFQGREDRRDIYKVNAEDGSGRTCITASDEYGGMAPSWSPLLP